MKKPEQQSTHLDAEQIRSLAHPIRARLLALLRLDGPATSSLLADRLDTNSGATSYHLRQLAAVGLVNEDQTLGTRRERWWRATHASHSWRESEHDADPDARAAADWLLRYTHRGYARSVEDWHDARSDWPRAWRDAAQQSDYLITVTARRLTELNRRIAELVNEYSDGDPNREETEQVIVVYYALPRRAVKL
jgi:predicted ArsR family transcriptional regulator